MIRKLFKWFIIPMLTASTANGQSSHVAGIFPTIDHSSSLNNKIDYGLYYFAAFPIINIKKPDLSNDAFFHLLYLEQSLTYNVNTSWSFTGSYLYQRANVLQSNYVNENRFYLQAKYKHTFSKINVAHRLRFDGRFIENRITRQWPFTHRLRYLVGIDKPINEKLYFTAYEELFFNTFKNSGKVYGENWAYAALGKKLNDKNKIELGLLYVTWNAYANNWFNQYYLQLSWINHLNFNN